jgi:hypothetical protein
MTRRRFTGAPDSGGSTTGWDSVGARFIPEALNKQIGPAPEDRLPESSPGHVAEWLMVCRGEKPVDYARANFLYSGPMTQRVLLGNLAPRMGRRIE